MGSASEESLLADAAKLFADQAGQHFSYFWSQTSESEKITLLSILAYSSARSKKGKKSTLKNLLKINPQALIDTKSLNKRGLIVEDDDIFYIFSSGLQTWIVHEITSTATKEKSDMSAEDWLKTSGQIDATGSVKVLPKFKSKYWSVAGKLAKEISFELMEHTFFSAITGNIF